jgi:6-pyruvoyl-tetrahydropterin synthase
VVVLWNKEFEKKLLFARLSDEDLVCVAAEAGLPYKDLCDEARRSGFIYIPNELKRKIIEELIEKVDDNKLVEVFDKVKPRTLRGEMPFRGNYYTYFGDGNLQLKSSWNEVKKDVHETLKEGGERVYAFLRAIIELTEEMLKRSEPSYLYIFGPDYGSILRRMREILGRIEMLTPRDFAVLKASGIYYKSGTRRYPSHSILLETIPAVKEALEEWRRSKEVVHH